MQVHIFEEGAVRTLVRDGQELFHAADVCKAMGYKKKSNAVFAKLDEDEIKKIVKKDFLEYQEEVNSEDERAMKSGKHMGWFQRVVYKYFKFI